MRDLWSTLLITALAIAAVVGAVALLVHACSPSREEALGSVRRFAAHTPGATGVECGGNEFGFRYCTIFRTDAPPLSLRCDDETCTGFPTEHTSTVVMPVSVPSNR